jgi:hypothetical protein
MNEVGLGKTGGNVEKHDYPSSTDVTRFFGPRPGDLVRKSDNSGHLEERVLELESSGAVITHITDVFSFTDRQIWSVLSRGRGDANTFGYVDVDDGIVSASVDRTTADTLWSAGVDFEVDPTVIGANEVQILGVKDGSDFVFDIMVRTDHYTFVRDFIITSDNLVVTFFQTRVTHPTGIVTISPSVTGYAATTSVVGFEEMIDLDGSLHLGVLLEVRVPAAAFAGFSWEISNYTSDGGWVVNGTLPIYSCNISITGGFTIEFDSYALPGGFDIPKFQQSLLVDNLKSRVDDLTCQFRTLTTALTRSNGGFASGAFEVGGLLQSVGMVLAVIPVTSLLGGALLAAGGILSAVATTDTMVEEGHATVAAVIDSVVGVAGIAAGVRGQMRSSREAQRRTRPLQIERELISQRFDALELFTGDVMSESLAQLAVADHTSGISAGLLVRVDESSGPPLAVGHVSDLAIPRIRYVRDPAPAPELLESLRRKFPNGSVALEKGLDYFSLFPGHGAVQMEQFQPMLDNTGENAVLVRSRMIAGSMNETGLTEAGLRRVNTFDVSGVLENRGPNAAQRVASMDGGHTNIGAGRLFEVWSTDDMIWVHMDDYVNEFPEYSNDSAKITSSRWYVSSGETNGFKGLWDRYSDTTAEQRLGVNTGFRKALITQSAIEGYIETAGKFGPRWAQYGRNCQVVGKEIMSLATEGRMPKWFPETAWAELSSIWEKRVESLGLS